MVRSAPTKIVPRTEEQRFCAIPKDGKPCGKALSTYNTTGVCLNGHTTQEIEEYRKDKRKKHTKPKPEIFDIAEWRKRVEKITYSTEARRLLAIISNLSTIPEEKILNIHLRIGAKNCRLMRDILTRLFVTKLQMTEREIALFFGYMHTSDVRASQKRTDALFAIDNNAFRLMGQIRDEYEKSTTQ